MATPLTVTVSIAAPPEKVYGMVADVTRMGEWSPENTGATWLKGASGPTVGAKFKGNNAANGKTWSTTGTVAVADPGKEFAFEVTAGPVKVARWSYSFVATETGCDVTEAFHDHRGGAMKVLGGLVSGVKDRDAHNRAGMEKTLASLKAAAEA